jgi:hypothetical protein
MNSQSIPSGSGSRDQSCGALGSGIAPTLPPLLSALKHCVQLPLAVRCAASGKPPSEFATREIQPYPLTGKLNQPHCGGDGASDRVTQVCAAWGPGPGGVVSRESRDCQWSCGKLWAVRSHPAVLLKFIAVARAQFGCLAVPAGRLWQSRFPTLDSLRALGTCLHPPN